MTRLGVDEGDPPTMSPPARALVDEPDAEGSEPVELGLNIGDPIGDMVHRVASLGKEAANRSVGIGGLDELKVAGPGLVGHGVDALLAHLEPFAVGEPEPLIGGHGSIEIGHDDSDVMELEGQGKRFRIVRHLQLNLGGGWGGVV